MSRREDCRVIAQGMYKTPKERLEFTRQVLDWLVVLKAPASTIKETEQQIENLLTL